MTEYREIVIKIPEEIISFVNLNGFLPENYRSAMGRVLLDGVELPEGHGKLIDADKLDRIMYHKAFETDSDMQKWDSGCWIRYKMFENSMKEMSTIIEADKGE